MNVKTVLSGLLLLFFAASVFAVPKDKANEIKKESLKVIQQFKKKDPGIAKFFNTSYGYVIFPHIGKGGFGIGGGGGKGTVFKHGKAAGNFLLNNHIQNLSVSAGGVWNMENYYNETEPGKNSLETYIEIQYNIYNLGDMDLNTSLSAYPGITEKGRFRSDFSFNLKYKFIADFFINLGFSYNFDNQPVPGATRFDYNFNTTFGWEL